MYATGYFFRTVGIVTNEIIKNYIDDQNDDVDALFNVICFSIKVTFSRKLNSVL